jgi:hypothetical protein
VVEGKSSRRDIVVAVLRRRTRCGCKRAKATVAVADERERSLMVSIK